MSDFVDFNLSLNLDGVEAQTGGFEMVPQGTYLWEIVNAEQVQTSTGNTGVRVSLKVVDGPVMGRTHRQVYSLKKDDKNFALGRFLCFLKAIDMDPNSVNGAEMIGRQLIADMVHRMSKDGTDATGAAIEGKLFGNIQNERSASEAAVEEAPPPPPPAKAKVAVGAKNGTATAAAARR